MTVAGVNLETLWLPGSNSSQITWVLLHEGLGCVELWREFPVMLTADTGDSVFVFSRQGYGRSDSVALPRPLDYMEREATNVLGAVLDKLLERLPGQQFIVLGHSDGGSIAAYHAGLCPHPQLLGALLVAPHFFTEEIAINAIRAARIAFESGNLRERLALFHFSNVDCAFHGWCDAWLDENFLRWDIRHCLPSIQIPMVLVQGDSDKYGTLQQLHSATELSGGWTDVQVIADCDHSPHRESPDALLQACQHLRAKCST